MVEVVTSRASFSSVSLRVGRGAVGDEDPCARAPTLPQGFRTAFSTALQQPRVPSGKGYGPEDTPVSELRNPSPWGSLEGGDRRSAGRPARRRANGHWLALLVISSAANDVVPCRTALWDELWERAERPAARGWEAVAGRPHAELRQRKSLHDAARGGRKRILRSTSTLVREHPPATGLLEWARRSSICHSVRSQLNRRGRAASSSDAAEPPGRAATTDTWRHGLELWRRRPLRGCRLRCPFAQAEIARLHELSHHGGLRTSGQADLGAWGRHHELHP
jgi:hypothetical protein